MKTTSPTYTCAISERELKEALEFYMLHKYKQDVTVSSLTHNVGYRTEGCGGMEMNVPYQEGLTYKVQDR